MTEIISLALVITAKLSWYDPSLCDTAPVNCFDPDRWWQMAAGHDARDWYGAALACPAEFPIGTRFVISGSRWALADGEWLCLDRGGAIVIDGRGVSTLDLLRRKPVWAETLSVIAIPPP